MTISAPKHKLELHVNKLPAYIPYSMEDIPSGSEIFLHLFQASGSVGQHKYLSWNSARMARHTGGQIYRWCFSQQASDTARHCASFNSNSKGFQKFVTHFLRWWCTYSSTRSKKADGIMTKFWYPGISVCIKPGGGCSILFLVLEVSRA